MGARMQVQRPMSRLLSLLLVYLTENYLSGTHSCSSCGTLTPAFGKTFQINEKWVCLDCVIQRIEGKSPPVSWELPVS